MECLHDRAPSDEDLIGFTLDGEALSKEAQSHFAQCNVCQQRMTRYQKVHASLVSRFYRNQCPPGTDLSLYALGFLSQEKRLRITDHIINCPLCQTEVEETSRFMQIQPVTFSVSSEPFSPIRRIFAILVSHSEMQPALRNDAQQSIWPRQYRAESLDLSLHLASTSSGEYVLLGILTCTNPAEDVDVLTGAPAELYAAPWSAVAHNEKAESLPLLRTLIDDLGNMAFKPVPAGEYTMVIHLPDREMIIEGLIIEEN
jgi:hypothetical protein